eukprot:4046706-Alexandrium_andersonii.AAC.1
MPRSASRASSAAAQGQFWVVAGPLLMRLHTHAPPMRWRFPSSLRTERRLLQPAAPPALNSPKQPSACCALLRGRGALVMCVHT